MNKLPWEVRGQAYDEEWKTPRVSYESPNSVSITISRPSNEEPLPPLPLPSYQPPELPKHVVGLVVSFGTITLLLLATLGITVKFLYVDVKEHQHQGTCEVEACSSLTMIIVFDVVYRNLIINPSSCPSQNETTCYYDDRDLPASLSIKSLGDPPLAVILMLIETAAIILITIATIKYYVELVRLIWKKLRS